MKQRRKLFLPPLAPQQQAILTDVHKADSDSPPSWERRPDEGFSVGNSLLMLLQANDGCSPKHLAGALALSAPHLTVLLDRSASMGFGDPPKALHAKKLLAAAKEEGVRDVVIGGGVGGLAAGVAGQRDRADADVRAAGHAAFFERRHHVQVRAFVRDQRSALPVPTVAPAGVRSRVAGA